MVEGEELALWGFGYEGTKPIQEGSTFKTSERPHHIEG
jgi:hypothetical protein